MFIPVDEFIWYLVLFCLLFFHTSKHKSTISQFSKNGVDFFFKLKYFFQIFIIVVKSYEQILQNESRLCAKNPNNFLVLLEGILKVQ